MSARLWNAKEFLKCCAEAAKVRVKFEIAWAPGSAVLRPLLHRWRHRRRRHRHRHRHGAIIALKLLLALRFMERCQVLMMGTEDRFESIGEVLY